jgi:hypothetical protein
MEQCTEDQYYTSETISCQRNTLFTPSTRLPGRSDFKFSLLASFTFASVAGLKEDSFPFAITYTEQKFGADFVTAVGVSNFLIVLQ